MGGGPSGVVGGGSNTVWELVLVMFEKWMWRCVERCFGGVWEVVKKKEKEGGVGWGGGCGISMGY